MEVAKTVNLSKLSVKKLKEMLKRHEKAQDTPQNRDAIRSIQWALKRKKQIPTVPTAEFMAKKLDLLKQLYKYNPEKLKAGAVGVKIT